MGGREEQVGNKDNMGILRVLPGLGVLGGREIVISSRTATGSTSLDTVSAGDKDILYGLLQLLSSMTLSATKRIVRTDRRCDCLEYRPGRDRSDQCPRGPLQLDILRGR